MVLRELTALRGVSGNEAAVRDYILERIRPLADVRIDRMGNLIAHKKGTEGARHVVLCAHMDEVGLMVTGIDDKGYLTYDTCGGIDPRVIVSKRVLVGEKAVPGVIGAKPIHLQSRSEFESVMKHDSLVIDIGAKDKADAERQVNKGDFVSFDSEWVEFGAGMVKAKALDDRSGCAILMAILENTYPCDLTCAFTVQEEVGTRGAQTVMEHIENVTCAIVLEGTTANDLGDVPEHLRVCAPGKGVAISMMDNSSLSHEPLWRALRALARKEDIPWQMKSYVSGGNDAGRLQRERGAVATAVLNVPCRYIHSPSSVASLADVDAAYRLVNAFLASNADFQEG
ncbi:MAG TPA: M20/M25/M40 family metallo-hydrolase [Candidatus Alectryocaccomicrobium excrementavium]|uniref:M20/M25/M40 family metallo-hydrolase n=1 Tax=Candidatus Alectryocaccomicrobium excrementavium TaxID=2840668 RepID=A0A9D1K6C5_9FIRM|nr:M20/M25/M40 family metallo-hydrolase [Candidatus Alectryocaccomicrobium excrementavium]